MGSLDEVFSRRIINLLLLCRLVVTSTIMIGSHMFYRKKKHQATSWMEKNLMMVVKGSKLAILLRENLLLPKQPHVKQDILSMKQNHAQNIFLTTLILIRHCLPNWIWFVKMKAKGNFWEQFWFLVFYLDHWLVVVLEINLVGKKLLLWQSQWQCPLP